MRNRNDKNLRRCEDDKLRKEMNEINGIKAISENNDISGSNENNVFCSFSNAEFIKDTVKDLLAHCLPGQFADLAQGTMHFICHCLNRRGILCIHQVLSCSGECIDMSVPCYE